jgi:hypothetical protein
MLSTTREGREVSRRCLLQGLRAGLAVVAGTGKSWSSEAEDATALSQAGVFATIVAYVAEFYPLWFTIIKCNTWRPIAWAEPIGCRRFTTSSSRSMSTRQQLNRPRIAAGCADDPEDEATYSILTLDPYGDILETGIVAQTPGTYALTGPRFAGLLPAGVTRIKMPLVFLSLIFGADKYSAAVENQINEAELFRKSLKLQTLSDYRQNPAAGGTSIVIEIQDDGRQAARASAAQFSETAASRGRIFHHPAPVAQAQALSNRFD